MTVISLRALVAATLISSMSVGAAWAQTVGSIPALQTTGTLQYTCGGIGSDESTAMRSEMKNFPLSLLFAGKNGDYLADLQVHIQGSNLSNPVRFSATGPVCLLKLPSGSYTVKVTSKEGSTQSKDVQVSRNGHTLDFRF